MSAVEHIQELTQETFIDLFELSRYNPAAPNDKFRFTNHVGVAFGGETFQAIPCQIDSIEFTSEGSQPEPTLTVADAGGVITDLISLYNNMEGAEVSIRRTQKRYLDGQASADPSAVIAYADFLIARRENHVPREYIVFTLANPIDVDGAQLPGRHALRKCLWRYRREGCGYTGERGYTLTNQPTLDSTQDRCAKTLQACRIRFGRNAVLPFGGFPGLVRRN